MSHQLYTDTQGNYDVCSTCTANACWMSLSQVTQLKGVQPGGALILNPVLTTPRNNVMGAAPAQSACAG